jgi:hypothetical protein
MKRRFPGDPPRGRRGGGSCRQEASCAVALVSVGAVVLWALPAYSGASDFHLELGGEASVAIDKSAAPNQNWGAAPAAGLVVGERFLEGPDHYYLQAWEDVQTAQQLLVGVDFVPISVGFRGGYFFDPTDVGRWSLFLGGIGTVLVKANTSTWPEVKTIEVFPGIDVGFDLKFEYRFRWVVELRIDPPLVAVTWRSSPESLFLTQLVTSIQFDVL